jgi:hypothetical protein
VQEPKTRAWTEEDFMNNSTRWPSTSPTWWLQFTLIPYPSRRVVPNINTPYVLWKNLWNIDELIAYMVLQPRCWVPCTPVIVPCSLGLVKRSLWGPLLCALRLPVRLHHFVWFSVVICALQLPVRLRRFVWYYTRLWFCGRSEIESMSSRFWCLSPRHLVATTPLSGIKLLTRCLQQIILVAKPTAVKIRPS